MYIVVGHHGRDDQCVAVRVVNMVCISITEGDVVHLPFELLRRPLVQTVNVGERSLPGFSDVAVLGSPRLFGEVRPTKDCFDFVKRFCLVLATMQLGSSVVDIVLEIPIADEFLNLILKHDTLLCNVVDTFVIPAVLALVSLGVASSQWVQPLEDACLLNCQ